MSRDAYALPPRGDAALSRRELLRLRPSRADVDYDAATARVRAEWEAADRTPLLRAIEPVAEALVGVAGVQAGQRVLDAGCGDGNVALACVRAGASVDACDLVEEMLRRGAQRCPEARFAVGDVQALPYPDARFDVVLSAFGFALAPRAVRAARELVRVCRPGGTVALAAWVPRGLPGGLDELIARPAGVPAPARWGHEPRLRARLEPLLDDVAVRTRSVVLDFPFADALFEQLVVHATPAVRAGFDRLLAAQNNRSGHAVVGARHVLVTGIVRAPFTG
jgi:SAM-dependent methyltransferase